MLKCNVVAFQDPHRIGYGCIVRDSHGSIIAAMYDRFLGSPHPPIAEALCIREAHSWLRNINLSNIILVSYALVVIDAINSSIVGCF